MSNCILTPVKEELIGGVGAVPYYYCGLSPYPALSPGMTSSTTYSLYPVMIDSEHMLVVELTPQVGATGDEISVSYQRVQNQLTILTKNRSEITTCQPGYINMFCYAIPLTMVQNLVPK